jgi:hypothetical protein
MSAPFRITRPPEKEVLSGEDSFKEYLSRLLKMIPAEIVGLYMIGSGFTAGNYNLQTGWIVICFVLVFVVRVKMTGDKIKNLDPQPVPILIAAIAFIIWTYYLGEPYIHYRLYDPKISSLAILLWSFIIPLFYKGDKS